MNNQSEVPDFKALRTKRNAAVVEMIQRIAKEQGWNPSEVKSSHNDDSCYCACPEGPCEHKWDGPDWQSDDGCSCSATCSRCGGTAMSHHLMVAP